MISPHAIITECRIPPENLAGLLRRLNNELALCHGRARRMRRSGGDARGLLAWGAKYLPAHFSRPPSNMHRWLAGKIDAMQTVRGMKLNLLGPRGGAKSTIGTLAFPLREAIEGREPYIWIVSDTKNQARATWRTSKPSCWKTTCWLTIIRKRRGAARCGGAAP